MYQYGQETSADRLVTQRPFNSHMAVITHPPQKGSSPYMTSTWVTQAATTVKSGLHIKGGSQT